MKFSVTTNVFVQATADPRRIVRSLQDGEISSLVNVGFWPWDDMAGYAKIGIAEIEIDVAPDCGVQQVVDALRAQLESDRAAFALRQKQINDQINSLLAIGNEPLDAENPARRPDRDTMQQFGDNNHHLEDELAETGRRPLVAEFDPDKDIPF